MLVADDSPIFAEPDSRYPLTMLTHGTSAHGIYDIEHAQNPSRQSYIFSVAFYGDELTVDANGSYEHAELLRPLVSKAQLDSIYKVKFLALYRA